ncbi:MAG: hypothetical protein WBE73_19385 [Candidatus Acidiferrum sp.]
MSRERTSNAVEPARLSDFYEPFPQQRKFHESKAKYRLFGGAAGPGKTKALLWEAIYRALRVPGSDGLLLRRTYPELESSLLTYFRRDVPRTLYEKYNEAKHVVTWRNGSTTRFGYCRNESDVYRYQGAEFLFIGLDELTHFTFKQWQFLTSRNRCPVKFYSEGVNHGKPVIPTMAGATNPGNIGHAWVKALWIDRKPPAGFEQADRYNPKDYEFIPARLADNPIYANDAEYRRTLGTLPEHLRKAFLDGDWNVFSGQYFDIFDYGRHTARPEEIRLETWWPRWISIDWGFQHPSAVYWHCAVPAVVNSQQLTADRTVAPSATGARAVSCELPAVGSRVVTYREFVQNGLSPRMLAQGIAERSGRENFCEVFLSPDAFAHCTAEASIAEQLGDVLALNGLPRPAIADDDRIGGWQFMYQMLETNAWVITENCTKLIECMPTLVRDIARVEDIRKMEGDDPADSARYGLVSGGRIAGVGTAFAPSRAGQPPPLKMPGSGAHFVTGMPLAEQISRQITATDPTSRAIHSQRLEAEARKQFRPKKFPRRKW